MLAVPVFAAEPEVDADPASWQTRYRELVAEARSLRETVERERELYADANRRNYRRGQKRHVHREAGARAGAALAEVEAQLATIEDDARRAGVPRGWLNQVEMEREDEDGPPTVSAGPGEDGRNPLYLKSTSDEYNARSAERDAGRNPLHVELEQAARDQATKPR
jgi:hypothetical protein